VLRLTVAAGRLAMVAVLAMVPELPMLAEGLAPVLDEWRASLEITGI
jgi:hypothetical protein